MRQNLAKGKKESLIKNATRFAIIHLMQIIVVFGLPGAGKSFVGKILQQHFNHFHYDGDISMPADMLKKINKQAVITDSMRYIFFQRLIENTKHLKTKYQKIVVSQTFIKEKYRNLFLQEFSEAKFILVETASDIREKRLMQRKTFPLDLEYSRKMCLNFDAPKIMHSVVNNDSDGEEDVKKQLQSLSI
jgi:gluconate kinase